VATVSLGAKKGAEKNSALESYKVYIIDDDIINPVVVKVNTL
jgi:hypothetical protein